VDNENSLAVAHSGETVQRQDQCTNCHKPMLYRCHSNGEPYEMFCQDIKCPLFGIEVEL
jgi:hypothetical protein